MCEHTIHLGVTGLRRTGKTVFLTSLIYQVCERESCSVRHSPLDRAPTGRLRIGGHRKTPLRVVRRRPAKGAHVAARDGHTRSRTGTCLGSPTTISVETVVGDPSAEWPS